MTTDRACWSRRERKEDFQKHAWEEKARHTLTQDPVGSQVDRVSQCNGSFLSCWSTCDLAHSAHSVPDTHQYLQQHKEHLASASWVREAIRAGIVDVCLEYWGLAFSSPRMNLVAAPKLLHPPSGDLDSWMCCFPDWLFWGFFLKKKSEKTFKNKSYESRREAMKKKKFFFTLGK